MKFVSWSSDTNYDHLDKSGKYLHATGVIPSGTQVKHVNDLSDVGTVINSNIERSLVQFRATGGGVDRSWYANNQLLIPESIQK